MKKKKCLVVFSLAVLVGIVLLLTGCPAGSGGYLRSQFYFDYPNSNVVPVGKVSATVSKTVVGTLYMDPDWEREVVQKALAQKDGDILIDATFYYKIKEIPLYIVYIYMIDLSVEGTACKMTIGKQILK